VADLTARAQRAGFLLQPTPVGLALVPVIGNRALTDEDLAGLRPEMREAIARQREELENETRAFLKNMRAAERATQEQLQAQDREVGLHAVGGLLEDLAEQYADQPEVSAFLEEVREGILADIALFRGHPLPTDAGLPEPIRSDGPEHALHERAFRKYEVNVIVDNGGRTGAPVVTELNPTYPNLIGRIEREALFGALVTDFTLIRAGALHRANGGYLVLRVEDVLRAPLAWEALKRALHAGTVVIEDVGEALGLTFTRSLQPDPIALDVKVFLVGSLSLYQLLYAVDADFRDLFKVRADFDVEIDRTPANEAAYAAFAAGCAHAHGRPLDREAVARLIEEASRLAADQRKLSARFGQIADVLAEAHHWADAEGAAVVSAAHVRRAVEQRVYRAALVQERLKELIARGVLLVRPEGTAVGQINGLAVIGLGEISFGRPSRITATVGAGRDGVIDIERQAELGGRIHSKGVLILGGYLTDTYAGDKPLALSARLVFEQSYDEVEGDSASLAELLALLSRLAEVPLRQGIAVTGSVNQRGEVQAVGGVNEKIEGYFDACTVTGLTGDQGVILPAANVDHLMLRDDVVEAVAAGTFHVYAVRTVDEALALLTGMPAAEIHARVDARGQ
jgi:lon-related putative ATP-dependent protease